MSAFDGKRGENAQQQNPWGGGVLSLPQGPMLFQEPNGRDFCRERLRRGNLEGRAHRRAIQSPGRELCAFSPCGQSVPCSLLAEILCSGGSPDCMAPKQSLWCDAGRARAIVFPWWGLTRGHHGGVCRQPVSHQRGLVAAKDSAEGPNGQVGSAT